MFLRLYEVLRRKMADAVKQGITAYHWMSVRCSRRIGVTSIKRNPELIVSLTTIPERIGRVALCIDCLLRQSTKPDRVILWLSEAAEPGKSRVTPGGLPPDLLALQRRGLDIRWCQDIGSYRKVIPALREYPSAVVVTADDDILYPRTWLQTLYEAYAREPQFVHCHRAHLIGYDRAGSVLPYSQWQFGAVGYVGPSPDLFPTTGGGVLYGPGQLHPEVLNESAFLTLCPRADDVWLMAMSVKAGMLAKKVRPKTFRIIEIRFQNNRTLWEQNSLASGNDMQIAAVANRYEVFRRRV